MWGFNFQPEFRLNPVRQQQNNLNLFQNPQQAAAPQAQAQEPEYTEYNWGMQLNQDFRLTEK